MPDLSAPVDSEKLLERWIAAGAAYQESLGNCPGAYNVHSIVQMIKRLRSPDTVARLDAERLQRAMAK